MEREPLDSAYESPLYGMVIELGLRLFGLTLLGVRFVPALIEFGALILTFFAFRKYFPQDPSAQFHTADGTVAMAFAARAVRRNLGVQRQPVSNRVVHVCPAY